MGRPRKNKNAEGQPANNNSPETQLAEIPTEEFSHDPGWSGWSLGHIDDIDSLDENPCHDENIASVNSTHEIDYVKSIPTNTTGEFVDEECKKYEAFGRLNVQNFQNLFPPMYCDGSSVGGVDFDSATNEYVNQVHQNYTKLLRDKYGLLNSVEHKFREDGYVDWQAMIPNEFLAVNKKNFEARGIDIPENIEDIAEKDKLILLDGFKHIARLRGVKSILKTLSSPSSNYVVATCTISFLPNYEYPNGLEITGEADCNADYERTFTAQVIATIAGNRAFIRAVRHALNIKIYGQDEMSSMDNPENKENHRLNKVRKTLADLCNDKNISFDGLKKALVKNGIANAMEYKDFKDIPIDQCSLAISKIKEKFQ